MKNTMKITLCTIFILLSQFSFSQENNFGSISGKIISAETKQPLPFINVILEGTKIGTSSNDEGKFFLENISLGNYTLIVSAIGFETKRRAIEILSNKTVVLSIEMKESSVELKEIQIVEEARKKSLQDIRSSVVELQPQKAKALPGAVEDVMRALQYAPGVIAPNDFRAALVVRGGNPDQNLIVMDGIEIFNPYRLYGLISMFNPETVSDISLLTGGFPAKYGDRLSAVIDVTNKRGGDGGNFNGNINASISNANIVLEGKTTQLFPVYWLASARRTYYDLVLEPFAKSAKLVDGDVAFPNFSDIQGKFTFLPTSKHQFIINGIASRDGVNIVSGSERKTADSVSVFNETRNDVAGVAWQYTFDENIISKLSFSWYRNKGESDFGGAVLDPGLDREQYDNDTARGIRLYNIDITSSFMFTKRSVKQDVLYTQKNHLFECGIAVDWLKNELFWKTQLPSELRARLRNQNMAFLENFLQEQSYHRVVSYAQDKWTMNDDVQLQPGIRLNYFHLLKKYYIEPRVNFSYLINPISTLRAAWGKYYQSPGYEKLVDQNVFYSLTDAKYLQAEQATHYILGYERWLTSEIFGKVETYYKRFANLIHQKKEMQSRFVSEPVAGNNLRRIEGWTPPHPVTKEVFVNKPENNSYGDAYGIEWYIEKKQPSPQTAFFGWISYALAWAQRNSFGVWRPLSYDQRHTFSLNINFKPSESFEVALKWKYGTNFPYSPPSGIQPRIITVHIDTVINNIPIDTTLGFIQVDSDSNVVFDVKRAEGNQINSERLPPYHRLDMRLTWYKKYWGLEWTFYLDIINVYNRQNVLSYQTFVDTNLKIERNPTTMFPILPTLGMSVRF
ncbi:MAG: hypothetical protein FJ218_05235 [Ignavibacteria bacterium]|nr:hypothetical protein [Ignavibacteria bacterium]